MFTDVQRRGSQSSLAYQQGLDDEVNIAKIGFVRLSGFWRRVEYGHFLYLLSAALITHSIYTALRYRAYR